MQFLQGATNFYWEKRIFCVTGCSFDLDLCWSLEWFNKIETYADEHYYWLPYFFSYKTEVFSFQNNPKNLDPSFKTDSDL